MRPTDLMLIVAAIFAITGVALIYVPAGLITAAASIVALWWLFFDEVSP
jgi:hypothetical protein